MRIFLIKVFNLMYFFYSIVFIVFNVKKGKIKKEKIGFVSEVVINVLEYFMLIKL